VAKFITAALPPPGPKPGVHVARVVKARERVSDAGNSMLLMTARFPDQTELGFVITFVEKAAKLIAYFARSAELILPEGEGVEVEILPTDVEGRLFYPVVELDGEGLEAVPKITKFLSRAEALAINPALEKIALQPQAAIQLPAVKSLPRR
jgi:hypothetical protein